MAGVLRTAWYELAVEAGGEMKQHTTSYYLDIISGLVVRSGCGCVWGNCGFMAVLWDILLYFMLLQLMFLMVISFIYSSP